MNGLQYHEIVYKLQDFYSVVQDYIKCRYLFCILIDIYRHGETSKEVLWKIFRLSEVEKGGALAP